MTAADHTHPAAAASATPAQPPYLAGDRVQILYMTERGTILADAYVTAVFPRADGSYSVNAVMSDARASFLLVPADRLALGRRDPRVMYGVDHTKPTE